MKEVVRAACPGCQRVLNMPAEWTGRTVRCKHCGHAMQVEAMAEAAPAMPATVPVAAATPMWEPLPAQATEYTAPAVPAAMAVPIPEAPRSKYVSAFDTRDKYRGRGSYRGPKKNPWVKYAVLGGVLVLVAGLGVFGANKAGLFRKGGSPPTEPATTPSASTNGGTGGGEPAQPVSGTFPRRMLAISIHSYLYCNPLHNGDNSGYALEASGRTGTESAVYVLAERWKVPKDQLYHLTDAPLLEERKAAKQATPKKGEPSAPAAPAKKAAKAYPLRSVIEGTVTQFADSSREQDRIVILFCGHAIEKKGKTYLVPLEGDLDEVETLIPLDWFYEKIGACKAQEKIVIFDVCRFHPGRGIERPSPGPMTEALETALHASPEGVTVITSCSKGEESIETDRAVAEFTFDTPGVKANGIPVQGSYFLGMLHGASQTGNLNPDRKLPSPGDPIPVERMTKWMGTKLNEVIHFKFAERTETLKATIKHRPEVAYNPAEPPPGRFEYPLPPPSADPRAVMSIIREIQLPPVKSFRDDAPPPSISDVLPFSQEGLKDYLVGELSVNDKPNPFQKAVLDAVEKMRGQRGAGSGKELPEAFGGETSDKAKEELRKVQEVPALVEAELSDVLEELEKVADQKEKQPKRWQVHFDYVVAQLKLRICYANQYNLALANVRGGKIPDLKPGDNGYRLTAETTLDKNTGANYKEMFNEARKALTDLAKENPNTPWSLLAKSDRTVAIGLRLTAGTVAGAFK
jgi:Caspase domain